MFRTNKYFFSQIFITVIIVFIDQITKTIAYHKLYSQPAVDVFPFITLVFLLNRGAAFGLLSNSGGWKNVLFIGLAILVSIFILSCLRHTGLILSIGLVCILGGTIGNLIDRICHQYVIDFILIHYNNWNFPVFNIADMSISVGVFLSIFDLWRAKKKIISTYKL